MFVILKIVQTDKKSIRRGKTISDIKLRKISAGNCFYEVEVIAGEKGVNWQEVSEIVGKHGKHILLSDDVILPENCPLTRFNSAEFRNVLIFNTVELILKELFFMGERVSCVVNDPEGKYASYINRVVSYASRTTVVTDNEFRYFADIREVYSRYGAGVTLTTEKVNLRSDVVYIDTVSEVPAQGQIVFAPYAGFVPFSVDGFGEMLSFCPSYISQSDFFGAVMTLNGEKSLRQAVCRTFLYDKRQYTVYETARLISARKNKSETGTESIIFYV